MESIEKSMEITEKERESIVESYFRIITRKHWTILLDENRVIVHAYFDDFCSKCAEATVKLAEDGSEYIESFAFYDGKSRGRILYPDLKIPVNTRTVEEEREQLKAEREWEPVEGKSKMLFDFTALACTKNNLTRIGC